MIPKIPYSPNHFPHWHAIPVRFRDLDPLRHVNNALYSTYFEEARMAFIRQFPALSMDEANREGFVLAHARIDFLAQFRYPNTAYVGTGVLKVGNSSLTLHQACYNDARQLVAASNLVVVWMDFELEKPIPLPKMDYHTMLISPSAL